MGCGGGGAPTTDDEALSGRPTVAFRTGTVPVCWEDARGFEEERALVRTAVAETWEKASGGAIAFVGWDACESDSRAVRIRVDRVRAYTHAFGTNILGMENGLELNFTFGPEYAWGCTSPDSVRRSCIYVDAVHEFGHVLGFSHEQNRADRPSTSGCTEDQIQAGLDDESTRAESTLDTMYDPTSIMNYCNPDYWDRNDPERAGYGPDHPWVLSDADQHGMRVMYPLGGDAGP